MERAKRERKGKKQFEFKEPEEAPKTLSQVEELAKQQEIDQSAQEPLPIIHIPENIFLEMKRDPDRPPQYLEKEVRFTETRETLLDRKKREEFLHGLEGFKLFQKRLWLESSDPLLKVVSTYLHTKIDNAKSQQMKVTWLDCCHALIIGPLPDPNPHLQVDTKLKNLLHRKVHTETVAHERRDEAINLIRQEPILAKATARSYQEAVEVEEHIKENFTIETYRKVANRKYLDEIVEYEKEAFKKFFAEKSAVLQKVDRDDPERVFVPLPCVFRVVRKVTTLQKNAVCCWNQLTSPQDLAEHKLLKEVDYVMRKWRNPKVQKQVSDQQAVVSPNEPRDLDLLHRLIYGNSMKEKNTSDFYHSKADRTESTIKVGDTSRRLFISSDICLRSKALLRLREKLLLERNRNGIILEATEEPADAIDMVSLEPGVREQKKLLAARAKNIPEEILLGIIKNALNHKIRVDNLFRLYNEEEPVESVSLVDVITNAEFLGKRVLGLKN
jgi:hypothetical protein